MSWWIWVITGFALLSLELFLPTGFFLFVFGLSALFVGALLGFGLKIPVWAQFTSCAVLAVVMLPFFRKYLPGTLLDNAGSAMKELVGEEVKMLTLVEPGAIGQGELRGTVWRVRNQGKTRLEEGGSYRVTRVDGLTLEVE